MGIRLLILVAAGIAILGCDAPKHVRRTIPASLFSTVPWDRVLATHVDRDGYVDYESVARDSAFWTFVAMVNGAQPSRLATRQEQLAFWINAYNALAIQLITDNMPVSSITDIAGGLTGAIRPGVKSPWDLEVTRIEDEDLTLQEIEDDKVRALGDERIHFAIHSAAMSCPRLMAKAYTAENLNDLLDQARSQYLGNRRQNYLKNGRLYLSKIFDWYRDDFIQTAGSLQLYVARYWPDSTEAAAIAALPDSSVEFLDYNWRLASQSHRSR